MSSPTRARARKVAAALLLAATALSGAALADGAADADRHFRRGVERYKDNDFTAALVEFQRAYETQPSYQVLYNIGETQYQLQDWASALKTFQRYLQEGGKRILLKRKRDVEKEIEKLKTRVATVKLTTTEPGATITVDDVAVGETPLAEPLIVSSGKRRITATLPGRPPVTEVVQLAGGDVKDLSLTIPPSLQPKIVTKEAPSLAVPVSAWAATGAIITGAVVTGVLALGASGDLKDQLAAFPADPKAIESASKKALGFSVATDVLTAAAVAAGGVSIWLTVRHRREAAAANEPPAPPGPSARIVVYPNGVGVAGTF